jgi:hypothetical protein
MWNDDGIYKKRTLFSYVKMRCDLLTCRFALHSTKRLAMKNTIAAYKKEAPMVRLHYVWVDVYKETMGSFVPCDPEEVLP